MVSLSLGLSLVLMGGKAEPEIVGGDGAWCWFGDPRAVAIGAETWTGWVSREGDIVAGMIGADGSVRTHVLAARFERDDHDNPSFLVMPDKRVMAFWSKHSSKEGIWTSETKVGDFGGWTQPRLLKLNSKDLGGMTGYTYPNPQFLADFGEIVMTWRGLDWKPTMAVSRDGGKSWGESVMLFARKGADASNRPYTKVVGDGRKRIHFFVTDGHPRNESKNSVYHFAYEKGKFFRADGSVIGGMRDLPLAPEKVDVVYDGISEGVRSWIWDAAIDPKGYPVATYTRLPVEDRHEYRYVRWDGRRWVDRKVTDGGKWFPDTPEGKRESEPHYSGGIVIDHGNPARVALSKEVMGVHEVFVGQMDEGGDSWTLRPITVGSGGDQVRPVWVRGANRGVDLMWMDNSSGYLTYQNFRSRIVGEKIEPVFVSDEMTKRAVLGTMESVADWRLANPVRRMTDWTNGAFLAGVSALMKVSESDRYADALVRIGEQEAWKLGPSAMFADDHCVGQTYLDLYARFTKPEMIADCLVKGQMYVEMPKDVKLGPDFEPALQSKGEWNWCDALFMGPAMLAKLSVVTGEKKYLDAMDALWWKTTDHLYDKEEHLYYRDARYFSMREKNGKKIFWSRGNGWVYAGLCRVLEEMPQDYPSRPKYLALYREMTEAVLSAQQSDGLWRSSLLDPESYPAKETSGSGFYTFGLAWGLNRGLVDKAVVEPRVKKAWSALVACVDADGKLGWTQPIGADPRSVKAGDSEPYGAGAFLLAGSEVLRLAK